MVQVSVVIPAYRSGRFIRETVESVLAQTGVDFEVLVSVQGPEDGTFAILEELKSDQRLQVFQGPDGGAKENWDFITEKASGEYLKMLPADDVLMPGILARQVALLESHPESVMTASLRQIIDEENNILKKSWGLMGIPNQMKGSTLVRRVIGYGINVIGEPGGVLLRRATFIKAGGWRFEYPYVVDLNTFLHVLQYGDFVKDNTVAVKFRISSNQWSAELKDVQAANVHGMNEQLAALMPDAITGTVLWRGRIMASTMQNLRKMLFKIRRK